MATGTREVIGIGIQEQKTLPAFYRFFITATVPEVYGSLEAKISHLKILVSNRPSLPQDFYLTRQVGFYPIAKGSFIT